MSSSCQTRPMGRCLESLSGKPVFLLKLSTLLCCDRRAVARATGYPTISREKYFYFSRYLLHCQTTDVEL